MQYRKIICSSLSETIEITEIFSSPSISKATIVDGVSGKEVHVEVIDLNSIHVYIYI